ncbi:sigma-70 family RNA polymerase sigma factor [Haloferula sp.]|uniref:sigma-70 family RNA polymerase sigma factor n=1 Tax=Haloferula sp. TaxID=2497595 RepID=UPI003C753D07
MAHSSPESINEDAEAAEAAFVSQMNGLQGTLLTYVNTLLPGEPEVADIVQNTNVILWKKRADFEPGSNFRAWAFSVAYWEVRTWLTNRRRKSWLVFDEDLVTAITERFMAREHSHGPRALDSFDALRHCLAKLPDADRLVLLNHYQHGKSLEECSRVFGRSQDALRMAVFRLRAGLRRCINSKIALERVHS